MKNYLGDYLKQARLKKGYTQKGFAELMKVHYRMIQQWENEHVIPGAKYLLVLIRLLELDLNELEKCIELDEK